MRKQYSFFVDKDLYVAFKRLAKKNNRNVAILLRDFMASYIEQGDDKQISQSTQTTEKVSDDGKQNKDFDA